MKILSAAAFVTLFAVASAGPMENSWPVQVERIGWTLVHSVWQLAAVALVAALVDFAARRSSANARYIVSALALGTMLLLPGVTWLCIAVDRPAPAARPVATNPFQAAPLSPRFESPTPITSDPQSPDESPALAAIDGAAHSAFRSTEIPGTEFPRRVIPDDESGHADPNDLGSSSDVRPLFPPRPTTSLNRRRFCSRNSLPTRALNQRSPAHQAHPGWQNGCRPSWNRDCPGSSASGCQESGFVRSGRFAACGASGA